MAETMGNGSEMDPVKKISTEAKASLTELNGQLENIRAMESLEKAIENNDLPQLSWISEFYKKLNPEQQKLFLKASMKAGITAGNLHGDLHNEEGRHLFSIALDEYEMLEGHPVISYLPNLRRGIPSGSTSCLSVELKGNSVWKDGVSSVSITADKGAAITGFDNTSYGYKQFNLVVPIIYLEDIQYPDDKRLVTITYSVTNSTGETEIIKQQVIIEPQVRRDVDGPAISNGWSPTTENLRK